MAQADVALNLVEMIAVGALPDKLKKLIDAIDQVVDQTEDIIWSYLPINIDTSKVEDEAAKLSVILTREARSAVDNLKSSLEENKPLPAAEIKEIARKCLVARRSLYARKNPDAPWDLPTPEAALFNDNDAGSFVVLDDFEENIRPLALDIVQLAAEDTSCQPTDEVFTRPDADVPFTASVLAQELVDLKKKHGPDFLNTGNLDRDYWSYRFNKMNVSYLREVLADFLVVKSPRTQKQDRLRFVKLIIEHNKLAHPSLSTMKSDSRLDPFFAE